MTRDEELLLEQVTSAYRERTADGAILPSPAFYDLSAELRRQSFDETLRLRRMEAGLGRTTTAAAVRARIRNG